jgi:hypothetical protein
MPNKKQNHSSSWLISVFFREYGPFTLEELALRASGREFGWDMYVYNFPKDNVWRPARDIPELREILLKHFPLQPGDEGPAGGRIMKSDPLKLIEISPTDAGYCSWENAETTCKNFSFNGYGSWRFPTPSELSSSAWYISEQAQTTELTLHWSNERKGATATAVYTSRDSKLRGSKKALPITEWHPIRPVRDIK